MKPVCYLFTNPLFIPLYPLNFKFTYMEGLIGVISLSFNSFFSSFLHVLARHLTSDLYIQLLHNNSLYNNIITVVLKYSTTAIIALVIIEKWDRILDRSELRISIITWAITNSKRTGWIPIQFVIIQVSPICQSVAWLQT